MTTDGKQYSYDLTARLSYFVISIELIFCGYVLLHAKEFIQIQYLSKLFLISGLSVIFGLLWRFAYNQTHHERQHSKKPAKWLMSTQLLFYWAYIALTVIFFVASLYFGYSYLSCLKATA